MVKRKDAETQSCDSLARNTTASRKYRRSTCAFVAAPSHGPVEVCRFLLRGIPLGGLGRSMGIPDLRGVFARTMYLFARQAHGGRRGQTTADFGAQAQRFGESEVSQTRKFGKSGFSNNVKSGGVTWERRTRFGTKRCMCWEKL